METKLIPPSRPASLHHGVIERGLTSTANSRLFEGRFGRMFRTLPPAIFDDKDLENLAAELVAVPEPKVTSEDEIDDEENFGLPAGYTYFGQFIDHDITFDPMSSLMKQNDPDGLVDFRTPALDLDNLYGRGPDDQPYMYDETGRKFILSTRKLTGGTNNRELAADLPRFGERALIGDKRNDENVIVSQLQGLFLRFHNYVADSYPDASFKEIQQIVRWHYQWLVIFDFLPRIIGEKQVLDLLPHLQKNTSIHDNKPALHFFKWHNFPFMPVEFSGAAYRFGHSMIRPVYRLSLRDLKNSKEVEGVGGRKMIFSPIKDDGLNGFRIFPSDWGIEWDLFFDTRSKKLSKDSKGRTRVQPSYKIDTSLVNPLGALPEFSKKNSTAPADKSSPNSLALRNLKRGQSLGLPSGQDVARFMGLSPLSDKELIVAKANVDGNKEGKAITAFGESFKEKSPLWFYILAEARNEWVKASSGKTSDDDKNTTPTLLGPVGGRIVGEVLLGLILGDSNSFLSLNPGWKPLFGIKNPESVFKTFIVGDIVDLLKK